MPEVRVDPLTGLKTIIAGERAERPNCGIEVPAPYASADGEDPFLEGQEDQTPAELDADREPGTVPGSPGWRVRAFQNRYPAVHEGAADPPPQAREDLFGARAARGCHEVIVNSPHAHASLGDLDRAQLERAMIVWRRRMGHHCSERGAAFVHLFVNDGTNAGASQPHTHAQLVALDFVPALVARERERFGAYAARTMGGNLLADLVQEEVRMNERLVAVDEECVTIAPWASASPYQLMIVPRRPAMRWEEDDALGAGAVADALARLRHRFGALPSLNLWVRTAPRGADHYCWRIDIRPRLGAAAGLELGSGVELNPIAPERAARELRAD